MVPWPGSSANSIRPSAASTTLLTTDKPKPNPPLGAVSGLRSEERLEDPRPNVGGDTLPLVVNADLHQAGTAAVQACRNRDHTPRRGSFDGVGQQIEDDLIQSALRHPDFQTGEHAVGRELDTRFAAQRFEHRQHVLDHVADDDLGESAGLRGVQRVHLPHDAGDAGDFPIDPLDHVAVGMVGGHGVSDQTVGVLDPGQGVVDFVGDARGHPAGGRQLLRLGLHSLRSPERLFCQLAFRDVHVRDNHTSRAVAQGCRMHQEPTLSAGGGDQDTPARRSAALPAARPRCLPARLAPRLGKAPCLRGRLAGSWLPPRCAQWARRRAPARTAPTRR